MGPDVLCTEDDSEARLTLSGIKTEYAKTAWEQAAMACGSQADYRSM